tara:strand:+ start:105 stop:422 length:318 start_codon:yes stop_codon:yes gene_type:complete
MSPIGTVVSCICVIVWSVLLWEAWKTPVTPDNFEEGDFDIEKQQINPKALELIISKFQKTSKKGYTKKQIKQWIKFGIHKKYIDKTDKEHIIVWINLLNNKIINL